MNKNKMIMLGALGAVVLCGILLVSASVRFEASAGPAEPAPDAGSASTTVVSSHDQQDGITAATVSSMPEPAAPKPLPVPTPARPQKPISPVPAEQVRELQKLAAESEKLQGQYKLDLIEWREKSKTVKRADDVGRKMSELLVQIAKERELEVACFAGIVKDSTPQHKACAEAGKLWGLDDAGRVATQRPPPN